MQYKWTEVIRYHFSWISGHLKLFSKTGRCHTVWLFLILKYSDTSCNCTCWSSSSQNILKAKQCCDQNVHNLPPNSSSVIKCRSKFYRASFSRRDIATDNIAIPIIVRRFGQRTHIQEQPVQ